MATRDSDRTAMQVREYGTSGPVVVVLHGGPGAPGYMGPLARGLEDSFRVLEHFQQQEGVCLSALFRP